jgi:hypothetical protein
MAVDLLERGGDLVHVLRGAEEQCVFEPDALRAEEIAVGPTRLAVVQPVAKTREIRTERLLPEQRLCRQ